MLTVEQEHGYQITAEEHQFRYKHSMLWLGTGLGKTLITLSTINRRMQAGQVTKTLIFGPLRVIHSVWENESRKWDHLKHLRFQVIHGTEKLRERRLFNPYADIYLINYENMAWLAGVLSFFYLDRHKNLPFQMVVYDEITKVKKSNTVRMAGGWKELSEDSKIRIIGWKKILDHFEYRTGLTATPASNGYPDLHGQYLVVDGGTRLGKFVTHFRSNFLTSNYNGFGYRATDTGIQQIKEKIKDITIEMSTEDYSKLPDNIINDIMVDLPPKVRKLYDKLEKEYFCELDEDNDIEIFSKASLSNKCLQFCNGSPYLNPHEPEWYHLHDIKLKALEGIVEEAGGNPVLVAYNFRSDAERIMKKFKKYNPVNLTRTPAKDLSKVIKAINNYQHGLVIGHPNSMGHGIDGLQENCHIGVWFGLNWNLEYVIQLNGRYIRQGQKRVTYTHRILCRDTFDEVVRESLLDKDTTQKALKKSIKRYRERKEYNFW